MPRPVSVTEQLQYVTPSATANSNTILAVETRTSAEIRPLELQQEHTIAAHVTTTTKAHEKHLADVTN